MSEGGNEKDNFVEIGDHRDIPMNLGLLIMAWNDCELQVREMLTCLAGKGSIEHRAVVEPLVSDLGSLGLSHALGCYVTEFPDEETEIPAAISRVVKILEVCRTRRNYYVHGFSGVTRYGFHIDAKSINSDAPFTDYMKIGPFGKIYNKTAKGEAKFNLDFVTPKSLADFNNYLADFSEYLSGLNKAIRQYLHPSAPEGCVTLPALLAMPESVVKPAYGRPTLRRRPALAPWPELTDDENAGVPDQP